MDASADDGANPSIKKRAMNEEVDDKVDIEEDDEV